MPLVDLAGERIQLRAPRCRAVRRYSGGSEYANTFATLSRLISKSQGYLASTKAFLEMSLDSGTCRFCAALELLSQTTREWECL